MLDGTCGVETNEVLWGGDGEEVWRACDRRLRRNAKRRAGLDAEELELLREAERLTIWRPLGMVSLIDYMERALGYAPETAQKRLRVARRLGELYALSTALRDGRLSFSAVRELSRVATPSTERAWRDAALGVSNLRALEELVTGHAPGDLPDDPKDPALRTHAVRYELSASTYALLRQARLAVDEAHGSRVDDDALVAAMAHAVLEGTKGGDVTGRAKFQIALTVCERCDAATQDGAGARIAVDAATVERARCDAQHIGSLLAQVPARAYQDIPPTVARFVWHRDGGRCQTPGCRSSHGLEIHHIIARKDGGTNDPSNLTLRCSSCHIAHHEGRITIGGTAPDKLTLLRREEPARGRPRVPRIDEASSPQIGNVTASAGSPVDALATVTLRTQARDALASLGWKKSVASYAVDQALAVTGASITIDALLREALRRCPTRTS